MDSLSPSTIEALSRMPNEQIHELARHAEPLHPELAARLRAATDGPRTFQFAAPHVMPPWLSILIQDLGPIAIQLLEQLLQKLQPAPVPAPVPAPAAEAAPNDPAA